MVVNIPKGTKKESHSELQVGAFTFIREQTGRIILNVDVDSGLYPMRLTNEQTSTLAHWLLTGQTNEEAE